MDSFERDIVSSRTALLGFAIRLVHNKDHAEDLVQDTIVKALTNRHRFEPGTKLLAWLIAILKNVFRSEYRRTKREVLVDHEQLEGMLTVPANQDTVVEYDEVMQEVARLPHEHQHAVHTVGMQGHRYKDVAERTEVCVGTIKSRLNRARETLHEKLDTDRGTDQIHKRTSPRPKRLCRQRKQQLQLQAATA